MFSSKQVQSIMRKVEQQKSVYVVQWYVENNAQHWHSKKIEMNLEQKNNLVQNGVLFVDHVSEYDGHAYPDIILGLPQKDKEKLDEGFICGKVFWMEQSIAALPLNKTSSVTVQFCDKNGNAFCTWMKVFHT
jgi:hypothetical protein